MFAPKTLSLLLHMVLILKCHLFFFFPLLVLQRYFKAYVHPPGILLETPSEGNKTF